MCTKNASYYLRLTPLAKVRRDLKVRNFDNPQRQIFDLLANQEIPLSQIKDLMELADSIELRI